MNLQETIFRPCFSNVCHLYYMKYFFIYYVFTILFTFLRAHKDLLAPLDQLELEAWL